LSDVRRACAEENKNRKNLLHDDLPFCEHNTDRVRGRLPRARWCGDKPCWKIFTRAEVSTQCVMKALSRGLDSGAVGPHGQWHVNHFLRGLIPILRLQGAAMNIKHVAVFGLLTMLCGCGPSEGALRTRAAFDMQCPADQVQITELARYTRGVSGCGKRGTYIVNANTLEWILNSDATSEPQPAPSHQAK
jgi:hypothetical protein